MKLRFISILLTVIMIISLVPAAAFAGENADEITVVWSADDIDVRDGDMTFTDGNITFTSEYGLDEGVPAFPGGGWFSVQEGLFTRIEITAEEVYTDPECGWCDNVWTGREASVSVGGCYIISSIVFTIDVSESDVYTAKAVDKLIRAIREVVYTDGCHNRIVDARDAYDELTDDQKSLVTEYAVLLDAEAEYDRLKTIADEQRIIDEAAARAVDEKIDAIVRIKFTPECANAIAEARAAYDALTSTQKQYVYNYWRLEYAEEEYSRLKAADDAKKNNVIWTLDDMINGTEEGTYITAYGVTFTSFGHGGIVEIEGCDFNAGGVFSVESGEITGIKIDADGIINDDSGFPEVDEWEDGVWTGSASSVSVGICLGITQITFTIDDTDNIVPTSGGLPEMTGAITPVLVSSDTSAAPGLGTGFSDIDSDAWYYDSVLYCVENGIMAGFTDDTFRPDGTTSRAQIVTMLWNMSGNLYANYAMNFTDVDPGQWYAEAIRWAAAEKIVSGYSDGSFRPDQPVTREQLAVILHNYAKYKGLDVSVDENTNFLSFNDFQDISEWAKPAMMWAIERQLMVGNNWDLKPQGDAQRAQAATMIQNFCGFETR